MLIWSWPDGIADDTRETTETWTKLRDALRGGSVGAVPTDTIVGLTGNAFLPPVRERLLAIKGRATPMSIIPHSQAWARAEVALALRSTFDRAWLERAGAFTTLWPRATPERATSWIDAPLIGFRRPHHWITALASAVGAPLFTTSVNRTGQSPTLDRSALPKDLADELDFWVDEAADGHAPSTIIDYSHNPPLERRRMTTV